MEFQQLRHLLAATEHGNLLKAANGSFISQSGLSRSIKSLEQRLGVPLLVRGPKGVEPTAFGLSILRRAKVILNEVQRATEEVRAIAEARIGEVSFGITQNYTGYLVPELLTRLSLERPELRITVISDGFVELMEQVRTEGIDFAFGLIGPVQHSDEIEIERLRGHRSRVLASRHNHLSIERRATLEELSEERWVMLNSESVQRSFTTFFESRGLRLPSQVIKANSVSLIRRLVTEMDVLTVLPVDVMLKEIEAGLVMPIDCETPVEQTRIGLFFRSGGLLTPQASFVIDRFRAAVEASAPSPAG